MPSVLLSRGLERKAKKKDRRKQGNERRRQIDGARNERRKNGRGKEKKKSRLARLLALPFLAAPSEIEYQEREKEREALLLSFLFSLCLSTVCGA